MEGVGSMSAWILRDRARSKPLYVLLTECLLTVWEITVWVTQKKQIKH